MMAGPWENFQTASPGVSVMPQGPWSQFQTAMPGEEQALPKRTEAQLRAEQRVAREAAAGFKPSESAARYLPIGSWLDEASAGIDAGLNMVSGGLIGQPYEDAKAYQDARNSYVDENTSGIEKGAAMVGGMAASLPMGALNVFRGTTMLPQMGNALATGAAYGGVYGAGEGEGTDRIGNALIGTAVGAGTGAAVVPVARGVGNAINYARNRMAPLPAPIAGMERGAVNRVSDDMMTSGLDRASYARQAQELGPRGMLLDMGDDLRGSAEVLAQTRGPQLPIVRGNLNTRRNEAPDEIRNAITRDLGPEMNLPRYVENTRQAYSQAADPHYQQFYAAPIQESPQLRRTLAQIPSSAFSKAEELARSDGVRQRFRLRPVDEPMTPMTGVQGQRSQRVYQGIELDYLKRAIDDMARAADPGTNQQRIYGNLARSLRNEVDTILSPSDPAQSPWAVARSLAGDGIEGREAAELGGKVFSQKRDPNTVEAELGDLSQMGQRLYRYGARNDLRQIMGRGATNFGPRGDNTARRALNSEFNRENVSLIAGPRNAQRLRATVDAENRMADSFNEIMANSATARRQAGQNRLPAGAGPPIRSEAPRSFGEAAFSIARRGVNSLLNGALGERAGRIMADQARLLTARGIDRDTYVDALMRLADDRQITARGRDTIIMMLNADGQTTRTPLIEYAISPRPNP